MLKKENSVHHVHVDSDNIDQTSSGQVQADSPQDPSSSINCSQSPPQSQKRAKRTKRTMNAACDHCRSHHTSCDGVSMNFYAAGLPCTQCRKRGKACTYNYVSKVRQIKENFSQFKAQAMSSTSTTAAAVASAAAASALSNTPPGSNLTNSPLHITTSDKFTQTEYEPTNSAVLLSCDNEAVIRMFSLLCEGALSIWLDTNCSPLPAPSIPPLSPCAYSFVATICELDKKLRMPDEVQFRIDDVLQTVMKAYSSRWIYSSDHKTSALSKDIWIEARDKVHTILAIPSYRTIFTLIIFGWIPIPEDCEQSNYLEPRICVQVAFRQFHYLQPNVSQITAATNVNWNAFYWFTIVFDTAFSVVTRQAVSIKGVDRSFWDTIQKRDLTYLGKLENIPVNHYWVVHLSRVASACKISTWRRINRVQNLALKSISASDNLELITSIEEAEAGIKLYIQIYGEYFDRCEDQFHSLSTFAQMSCAYLNAHFHAGRLYLAEALDKLHSKGLAQNYLTTSMWCEASLALAKVVSKMIQTPLSPHFLKTTNLPPSSSIIHLDPRPFFIIEPLSMAGCSLIDQYLEGTLNFEQAIPAAKSCLIALDLLNLTMEARRAYLTLSQKLDQVISVYEKKNGVIRSLDPYYVVNPTTVVDSTSINVFYPIIPGITSTSDWLMLPPTKDEKEWFDMLGGETTTDLVVQ